MKQILSSWVKKLTNLSGSNKSLGHWRLMSGQDVDLHAFDFRVNEPSFSIVRALLEGKKSMPLCAELDSRDEKSNILSRILKRIWRTQLLIHEERGTHDLSIGWPYVMGKWSDGTAVRCPLLFIPIRLEVRSNTWYASRIEGMPIVLNKSFWLAYHFFNQIPVSTDWQDIDVEEWLGDAQEFRNKLYAFLKQSSIELHFNSELFADTLTDFTSLKRDERDDVLKTGSLKLYPEAVIGMFQQGGSYLIPDYESIIASGTFGSLESFFVERNGAGQSDMDQKTMRNVREDQTYTSLPMDSSQEHVIRRVKEGQSLVVQGPPGTGKSQLICNLITDFVARGKKVLVVSQKRAALEVIKNRLDALEIAPFVAVVHDAVADRKAIYEQVEQQIHQVELNQKMNQQLDTVYLERSFLSTSRQIDAIVEELESFHAALFSTDDGGFSAKELYLTTDRSLNDIEVQDIFKSFHQEALGEFIRNAGYILPYSIKLDRSDVHVWANRVSFHAFSLADKQVMLDVVSQFPVKVQDLCSQATDEVGIPISIPFIETQEVHVPLWNEYLERSSDRVVFEDALHAKNINLHYASLKTAFKKIQKLASKTIFHQANDLLEQNIILVEEARTAWKHWWTRWKWKLSSPSRHEVKRLCTSTGVESTEEGLSKVSTVLRTSVEWNTAVQHIKKVCNWHSFPIDNGADEWNEWYASIEMAKEFNIYQASIDAQVSVSIGDWIISYNDRTKINKLLDCIQQWKDLKLATSNVLSPEQMTQLSNGADVQPYLRQLEEDFEFLCECDRLKKRLSPTERILLDRLTEFGKNHSVEAVLATCENSIKLAWINYIEQKYPVLRIVSTHRLPQLEAELTHLIAQKIALNKQIVVQRLRENTYRDVQFNRLNNRVSYRDLLHQVNKKRKVWPLRKTISSFKNELFDLTPCWLASPETVSAVFDTDTKFDLVLFDEASQCYAERGFPAMYRARQVVVVGDSQQLSPYDLYQVRWDDVEDDNSISEADSLLDLCIHFLPQVMLTGHYRSRRTELIQFSNAHFYGDKLMHLPYKIDARSATPAIEYIKVSGVWKQGVNAIEALEVTDKVAQLLKEGKTDIGIVTFNYPQQMLIESYLEERLSSYGLLRPSSLFVKNIENVQGDERDIILFSIGYAPDATGKIHQHFGSLAVQKGENRLNVAVTRAREQVIIVASIYPHQLAVDQSKNEGPKLLKTYLEYARQVSEGAWKQPLPTSQKTLWRESLSALWTQAHPQWQIDRTALASLTDGDTLLFTDDELYHQTPSIKHAHAYTAMVAKEKGYGYTSKYSRQWWMGERE